MSVLGVSVAKIMVAHNCYFDVTDGEGVRVSAYKLVDRDLKGYGLTW